MQRPALSQDFLEKSPLKTVFSWAVEAYKAKDIEKYIASGFIPNVIGIIAATKAAMPPWVFNIIEPRIKKEYPIYKPQITYENLIKICEIWRPDLFTAVNTTRGLKWMKALFGQIEKYFTSL